MLLGSVSVDCRLHGTGQHRIWPRSLKSFELFVFSLLQVAAIKKVTVTTSHIPRHFKYLFTGHPKALQCALQGPQILCAHCVCNNQSKTAKKYKCQHGWTMRPEWLLLCENQRQLFWGEWSSCSEKEDGHPNQGQAAPNPSICHLILETVTTNKDWRFSFGEVQDHARFKGAWASF